MLQEQKAVVVGGTSGIGLAAATELCRAGAQVWVTGRTPDKAMGAAAAIGDRATGHAVDARDAVKLQDFFARVGEFDHLIVALGGGSAIGAFKELDEVKMRAGLIRADPRQCGIAWLDCHSLLGSHARGCPESDVRAFGRNRSSRPRRCAGRCRACCPVPC